MAERMLYLAGLPGLTAAFLLALQPHAASFFPPLQILVAVLLIPLLLTIRVFRWEPLYGLRFVLLLMPGVVTAYIVLTGDRVWFTLSALRYQTGAVATEVLLCSVLALSASAVAWAAGIRALQGVEPRERAAAPFDHARYFIYAAIAVISASFAADALGGFMWEADFAYQGMQPYLNIGVFSVFAMFALVGMYAQLLLAKDVPPAYRYVFWSILGYALLICLWLRGARLDVVGTLLAMYFLHLRSVGRRPRPGRLLAYALALLLLTTLWGMLRHQSIATGWHWPQWPALQSAFLLDHQGVRYLHLPTLADVAATFYQVVGLVQDGHLSLQLGQTYLNYLPRTLPAFLHPARPAEFSIAGIQGQATTGSLFELAEAYANFGWAGAFIVPACIGFILALVSRYAEVRPGFASFLAYGIAASLLLRGTWYQNFSFYKATVAWLAVEAVIWAVLHARLAIRRSRERHATQGS